MKILAWNCRGLGSPRAVRALLDVQKQAQPDVIFLSESHLDKIKAEKVRRRIGYDHMIIHESDGRSGGLLLLWKKGVTIEEKEVSKYFIDAVIKDVRDLEANRIIRRTKLGSKGQHMGGIALTPWNDVSTVDSPWRF